MFLTDILLCAFVAELSYSTLTASAGHTLLHVPQRIHLAASIWCFSYGLYSMASTGQCRAHKVQPMQSSVTE
jgi:purine-cytosine permease-like protein